MAEEAINLEAKATAAITASAILSEQLAKETAEYAQRAFEIEKTVSGLIQDIEMSDLPADQKAIVRGKLGSDLQGISASNKDVTLVLNNLSAAIARRLSAERIEEEQKNMGKHEISLDAAEDRKRMKLSAKVEQQISTFANGFTEETKTAWIKNYVQIADPTIADEPAAAVAELTADTPAMQSFLKAISEAPPVMREELARNIFETRTIIENAATKYPESDPRHAMLKHAGWMYGGDMAVMPEFQRLVSEVDQGLVDVSEFKVRMQLAKNKYNDLYTDKAAENVVASLSARFKNENFSQAANAMVGECGAAGIVCDFMALEGSQKDKAAANFVMITKDPSKWNSITDPAERQNVLTYAVGITMRVNATNRIVADTMAKLISVSQLSPERLAEIKSKDAKDLSEADRELKWYCVNYGGSIDSLASDEQKTKKLLELVKDAVAKSDPSLKEEWVTKSAERIIADIEKNRGGLSNFKDTKSLTDQKSLDSYYAGFVDNLAERFVNTQGSADLQKVQKETLKAVAESAEVKAHVSAASGLSAERKQEIDVTRKQFFAHVEAALAKEKAAYDAAPEGQKSGTRPYTAILNEIRAFDLCSNRSIELVRKIEANTMKDTELAYKEWQQILKDEYAAHPDAIKSSMQKLNPRFPGVVEMFNGMDIKKDIQPLILQMKLDSHLVDKVVADLEGLLRDPAKWQEYGKTPGRRELLVAYLAEAPLHMDSVSMCSYSSLKPLCAGLGELKDSNERASPNKVAGADQQKTVAGTTVPAANTETVFGFEVVKINEVTKPAAVEKKTEQAAVAEKKAEEKAPPSFSFQGVQLPPDVIKQYQPTMANEGDTGALTASNHNKIQKAQTVSVSGA